MCTARRYWAEGLKQANMAIKGFYKEDGEKVLKPGDFSCYARYKTQEDKIIRDSDPILSYGIIYCCPECGKTSAGTDNHMFDMNTNSCKPSLVHECGFHKTLTNGEYV